MEEEITGIRAWTVLFCFVRYLCISIISPKFHTMRKLLDKMPVSDKRKGKRPEERVKKAINHPLAPPNQISISLPKPKKIVLVTVCSFRKSKGRVAVYYRWAAPVSRIQHILPLVLSQICKTFHYNETIPDTEAERLNSQVQDKCIDDFLTLHHTSSEWAISIY